MKKILLIGLSTISLFALSLEDRVKILEEKVAKLEKQLNIVDKSQKDLKQNIVDNVVLKCNKMELVDYTYSYNDSGFIQSYDFQYKIKSKYKQPIKYLYASISFIDNEHTKLLEDYIKKDVIIKPNETKIIKTNYLIDNGSLAEYLKDTPKKDLKLEFKVFKIEFQDGKIIKCN